MKRILCTSIVLIMLLTACSAPVQQSSSTELNGGGTYGVYELDFSVERLSGWPFESWDFVWGHIPINTLCDIYISDIINTAHGNTDVANEKMRN